MCCQFSVFIHSSCSSAARKRFIESKLKALDQQTSSIDLYLNVLDTAKETKDIHKRFSGLNEI